MIYYKVNKEYDQMKWPNLKGFLIQNELYTEEELKETSFKASSIEQIFKKIELNPEDTYFFFGARFQLGESYNV